MPHVKVPLDHKSLFAALPQAVRPAPVKNPETDRLVVVAEVEVELREVKFCRVEEPVARRFAVFNEERDCVPPFAFVKKRLVEEPVVV